MPANLVNPRDNYYTNTIRNDSVDMLPLARTPKDCVGGACQYGLNTAVPENYMDFETNRLNAPDTLTGRRYQLSNSTLARVDGATSYNRMPDTSIGQIAQYAGIYATGQNAADSAEYNRYYTGGILDHQFHRMDMPYREPSTYVAPVPVSYNTRKKLSEIKFGDVPIISEISSGELQMLGSNIYRSKDRQKAKLNAAYKQVNTQALNDDLTNGVVRQKFHLNTIYGCPESRITTVLNPKIAGNSGGTYCDHSRRFYQSCRKPAMNTTTHARVDGAPSYSAALMPCEQNKFAVRHKDFVPTNYVMASALSYNY